MGFIARIVPGPAGGRRAIMVIVRRLAAERPSYRTARR